jgi:hypothetical protein
MISPVRKTFRPGSAAAPGGVVDRAVHAIAVLNSRARWTISRPLAYWKSPARTRSTSALSRRGAHRDGFLHVEACGKSRAVERSPNLPGRSPARGVNASSA